MLARIRAGLSYSNVMSTLAVFLAVGGGTAYAVDEWNGSNIQDGTLTGADVAGSPPDNQQGAIDGSLETWDVKDNTLESWDIRDGTILPNDIADELLGASEIADNSLGPAEIRPLGADDIQLFAINGEHVGNDALDGRDIGGLTGADVVDDSLDGFDVQNLSGADLVDGSVGSEDLAADAGGFKRVTTRNRLMTVRRRQSVNFSVHCPEGWLSVGGGYSHSSTRDPQDFAVSYNERFGNDGWHVSGEHVGGFGARSIRLRVSVNCVQ